MIVRVQGDYGCSQGVDSNLCGVLVANPEHVFTAALRAGVRFTHHPADHRPSFELAVIRSHSYATPQHELVVGLVW